MHNGEGASPTDTLYVLPVLTDEYHKRYYESQGWLLKGKFPASRGSIFATALIALLVSIPYVTHFEGVPSYILQLIIASMVVVLVARPETTEL